MKQNFEYRNAAWDMLKADWQGPARFADPGIPPGKIMTSDGRHGPKLVEALNSPNAMSATTGMRFELVTILSS